MDKQRCRFLLKSCRPNGADALDPSMSEALKLAQADPELSAWFAREQVIDRKLVEKLREFEAPPHLRDDILHGLAMTSAQRRRVPRFALLAGLTGVAAAAAITVNTFLPKEPAPQPSGFDSVVASAYENSRDLIGLNYFSASAVDLRAWLSEQKAPVPGVLPMPLNSLRTIGCSKFDWQGVPASLMSFRAPGLAAVGSGPAADRVMHLYTVEKQSCSGGSAHGEPIVFARDDQSIATWRDSSRFYVLVAQISEDRMERFLKGDLALADVTATIPSDAECYTCGEESH